MRLHIKILLLNIFIVNTALSQPYGDIRERYASASTCPIESIDMYKSNYNKSILRKIDPYLNQNKMYLSSSEKYNLNDQLQSDSVKIGDEDLFETTVYGYDDKNRMIAILRDFGEEHIYTKKQYLDNQIILQEIKDDKLLSQSIQYLDSDGRIKDWIFLSLNRERVDRYQYEYDEFGNESMFKRTGDDDDYIIKRWYKSKGVILGSEYYDHNNQMTEVIDYEEIENATFEDTEYVVVRTKILQEEIEESRSYSYEAETIEFKDRCNNVIKVYSNQNFNKERGWHITYLDIKYQE